MKDDTEYEAKIEDLKLCAPRFAAETNTKSLKSLERLKRQRQEFASAAAKKEKKMKSVRARAKKKAAENKAKIARLKSINT